MRQRRLTRDEVEERFGTIGGFRLPLGQSRYSAVWILLVVVFIALALVGGLPGGGGNDKVNLREVLQPFPVTPATSERPPGATQAFARHLQRTWTDLFARAGIQFRPAKIVAFDRSAASDCASRLNRGAFYCYSDSKLLVHRRLASPYLIAHAYAHHLQEVLRITAQIARAVTESPRQSGDLWRRHELQADCLAGVSLHSRYRPDEAAAMVTRAVLPTAPDHFIDREGWRGAPRAQRSAWFVKGLRAGRAAVCDTFSRDA